MEYIKLYMAFIILATYYQPKKMLASTYYNPFSMTNSGCSGLIHKLVNCSDDSMCPTWFTCTSQNSCYCRDQHIKGIIECDNDRQISLVLDHYCVTYDDETNSTYIGSCSYNCHNNAEYKTLPKQLINDSVCTQFHKTGLLCSNCEEGYSPFVLSYNLS